MRRRVPAAPAVALLVALAGSAGPTVAQAGRILVPEELSLSAAVAAAVAGDTLSLAPGSYERTPDPFVKAIVIEARTIDSPPILRRLEAGLVTLRHVDFAPEGPGEANPLLFRALDSATLLDCRFTGFAATAIDAHDAGTDHGWQIVVEDCQFSELNRGVDADFTHPDSRIIVDNCDFLNSFYGLRLVTPARACAPEPNPEPPPLTPGVPRLDLVNCRFDGLSASAIEAHHAAWAVSLTDCRIESSGLGLDLDRAGAFVLRTEILGNGFDTTGILARSSRIDVASSVIRMHALGIGLTAGGGCEVPAGVVGGQVERFNRLDTNQVALSTSHPIEVDDNWWGSIVCSEAQEVVLGVTIERLVDAAGSFEVDCMTPVSPTTWSRIKARLGP
jgi:hypothetical protein